MGFKKWYIWLLCVLMGCAQPSLQPVSKSIHEFYVKGDVLHVQLRDDSEIWIELMPGLDTYFFELNGKQQTLQYFKDNGQHVVVYNFQYYYINEY